MSENENSHQLIGELRSDVRHLQSDVTDIKAEQRITNQRLDSLSERMDRRFESIIERMDQRFDAVIKEIGGLRDSLFSAKLWAIGLYVTLAGTMLYVMARGFKWI